MATERRSQPRTDLHTPLFLLPAGSSEPIQTETENISLHGFFCYTQCLLAPGKSLKFLLLFPEVARDPQSTKATCLQGIAEVTRVIVSRAELGFGIGCRLATYRVLAHVDLPRTEHIVNTLLETELSHTPTLTSTEWNGILLA